MVAPAYVSVLDLHPELRPARSGDPYRVAGDLDLLGTPIISLPDALSIQGNLYLSHIPSGMDHPFLYLPNALSVGGDLFVSHASLSELPENLVVGGTLDLETTSVTHLPKSLRVGGRIYPSATLDDLRRLEDTLTEPLVLAAPDTLSAHASARIHQMLAPYPDVLRIWATIRRGGTWTISGDSPLL